MTGNICISRVLGRVKTSIEDAWKSIPYDAGDDAHALAMMNIANAEMGKVVVGMVESGDEQDFMVAAITQIEGISRANIATLIKDRSELAQKNNTGICLIDVVRDFLVEVVVQDCSEVGVALGHFVQEAEGRINLTPGKA